MNYYTADEIVPLPDIELGDWNEDDLRIELDGIKNDIASLTSMIDELAERLDDLNELRDNVEERIEELVEESMAEPAPVSA